MEYSNSQMQTLIDEYIHSARDAEILRLRLIRGYTYAAIANAVRPPLSERQVYRIVSKHAATLYRYLPDPDKPQ